MPRFVVHEHHARSLHYDFRLEIDGVLKSWAVPKGPTMNPRDRRLAIAVQDHGIEYAPYEGIIPEGEYGAGPVIIWDKGEFEHIRGSIGEGLLEFAMDGVKLKGVFVLTRLKGKEKEWLLIKKKDEYADLSFTTKPDLTPARLKKLKVKEPPCHAS